MLWFSLALAAALTQAGNDVISKRFFGVLTAYEMGLIRLLFAMPYLLVGFVFIPWPDLDRTFWLCMASAMPIEVIAFLYSLTSVIGKLAIRHSSPEFFGVIYFLFLGLIINSNPLTYQVQSHYMKNAVCQCLWFMFPSSLTNSMFLIQAGVGNNSSILPCLFIFIIIINPRKTYGNSLECT